VAAVFLSRDAYTWISGAGGRTAAPRLEGRPRAVTADHTCLTHTSYGTPDDATRRPELRRTLFSSSSLDVSSISSFNTHTLPRSSLTLPIFFFLSSHPSCLHLLPLSLRVTPSHSLSLRHEKCIPLSLSVSRHCAAMTAGLLTPTTGRT